MRKRMKMKRMATEVNIHRIILIASQSSFSVEKSVLTFQATS
jgi:hypothetical protein